jgi:hypothetical protein
MFSFKTGKGTNAIEPYAQVTTIIPQQYVCIGEITIAKGSE